MENVPRTALFISAGQSPAWGLRKRARGTTIASVR
jgi:hypothetical protein